ncbi:hypothetical protein [Mesorhizobium sp. M0488]|uniref:hypothetical protein n=1 Tax=unclassified Mesorhizobium TaxID=325217 RepID=UPI00333A7B6F
MAGDYASFVANIVLSSNTVLGRNGAVPYAEFLAELDRAGLSVRSFAELIGMNPNSVTNYAGRGELPQHIALVAVLWLKWRSAGRLSKRNCQGRTNQEAARRDPLRPFRRRPAGQPGFAVVSGRRDHARD